MEQLAYNDIRNNDWFNRLMNKVGEKNMRSVQSTGSQADDPYWAGVAAEERGDISNARANADSRFMADARSNQSVSAARDRAATDSRNAVIRAALARDPQFSGASTGLGTQSDSPAAGGVSGGVTEAPYNPISAPEAYGSPMSAQGRSTPAQVGAGTFMPYKSAGAFGVPKAPRVSAPAYNPAAFYDDMLEKQRRARDMEIQNLAFQVSNRAPMGQVNPYIQAYNMIGRK